MSKEKEEEGEHLTFKMKLYGFLDSTTLHGLRYVSDRQGRIVRRLSLLSLLTMFFSYMFFITQRYCIYEKFSRNPTYMKFQNSKISSQALPSEYPETDIVLRS